jgi:hypothetical protein
MNLPHEPTPDDGVGRALDAALARSLAAPSLPADFRRRLHAALAREAAPDLSAQRAALERESAAQFEALRSGYVRLKQRTLGTLIGAAFAVGLLINWALPWITAHYGRNGVFALPALGVAAGLALSLRAWWQRSGLERLLP